MSSFYGISLLLSIMVNLVANSDSAVYVHVDTTIGNVTGINKTVKVLGAEYHCSQFLGVPYADPPTDNRRFQRPKLYSGYHTTYNATYYRPHCMQSDSAYKLIKYFSMSEDCLYLNIYTPGKNVSTRSKFSVMVFIHGGSFSFGGADVLSGDVLSSAYDVVVVTLNYRLNVFGFMSDGTRSSGNFGLWDQQLALRWIHDNIEQFGGNPLEVTLFGSSSGAASVLFHATNPDNKLLFKRIIAQSGSFLAPWAIQRSPRQKYDAFIKDAGCSSAKDVTKCLRLKPAKLLAVIAEKYSFAPVVDGDYILRDPATLNVDNPVLGTGPLQFLSELDFLSGVNSKEGATVFDNFADSINLTEGLPRDMFEEVFVPLILSEIYGVNVSESIKNSVIHEYSTWPNPDDPIAVRDLVEKLAADLAFIVPAVHNAIMHFKSKLSKAEIPINQSSTYFYLFDGMTKFDPEPTWLEGAKHTLELPFVFGFPDMMKLAIGLTPDTQIVLPNDEAFLSHTMMSMWTNFAKTGNPNTDAWQRMTDIPAWPTFNSTTQKYLEFSLNMTSNSSKSHLAAERVAFWTNVVPSLRACVECICPELPEPEDKDSQTENAANSSRTTLLCLIAWLPLMYSTINFSKHISILT